MKDDISLSLSLSLPLIHTDSHTHWGTKSTSSCLWSQRFLTSKCIFRNQATQCANIIYLVKPNTATNVTGDRVERQGKLLWLSL